MQIFVTKRVFNMFKIELENRDFRKLRIFLYSGRWIRKNTGCVLALALYTYSGSLKMGCGRLPAP